MKDYAALIVLGALAGAILGYAATPFGKRADRDARTWAAVSYTESDRYVVDHGLSFADCATYHAAGLRCELDSPIADTWTRVESR